MKPQAKTKAATKTKTKIQQRTITRGMATLMLSGALLAAAAAGFANIKTNKVNLEAVRGAYPYQTAGYTPGYVPGYIPGRVPGYGVPGYVPGYGFFEALPTSEYMRMTIESIKNMKFR